MYQPGGRESIGPCPRHVQVIICGGAPGGTPTLNLPLSRRLFCAIELRARPQLRWPLPESRNLTCRPL